MKTALQLIAETPGVNETFRRAIQTTFPRADFQLLTRREAAYDSTSPVALPSGPYDLAGGR